MRRQALRDQTWDFSRKCFLTIKGGESGPQHHAGPGYGVEGEVSGPHDEPTQPSKQEVAVPIRQLQRECGANSSSYWCRGRGNLGI